MCVCDASNPSSVGHPIIYTFTPPVCVCTCQCEWGGKWVHVCTCAYIHVCV